LIKLWHIFRIAFGSTKLINVMSSKYEYEESEDSNGGGFISGLFIGAVLGALAAILYAPKSGNETRQQLKGMADQQKENLKNQWEQTKTKASETADAFKGKLSEVAEQAKGAVDVYADKAKGKVDHLADGTIATVDKIQHRY
jgi:gas vesicle protein